MICKLKYHIPYVTHLQAKEIKKQPAILNVKPKKEKEKKKRKKT